MAHVNVSPSSEIDWYVELLMAMFNADCLLKNSNDTGFGTYWVMTKTKKIPYHLDIKLARVRQLTGCQLIIRPQQLVL